MSRCSRLASACCMYIHAHVNVYVFAYNGESCVYYHLAVDPDYWERDSVRGFTSMRVVSPVEAAIPSLSESISPSIYLVSEVAWYLA